MHKNLSLTNAKLLINNSVYVTLKGMAWKVTMLVLSSLALIIGMVILFLSVYQNRLDYFPCRSVILISYNVWLIIIIIIIYQLFWVIFSSMSLLLSMSSRYTIPYLQRATIWGISRLKLGIPVILAVGNFINLGARQKKTVVVLKPYTSYGDTSNPGSPVLSEKAPLTKHPMKPPRSPSIQRGEILVEWKDGTVTPLFDTYQTS